MKDELEIENFVNILKNIGFAYSKRGTTFSNGKLMSVIYECEKGGLR